MGDNGKSSAGAALPSKIESRTSSGIRDAGLLSQPLQHAALSHREEVPRLVAPAPPLSSLNTRSHEFPRDGHGPGTPEFLSQAEMTATPTVADAQLASADAARPRPAPLVDLWRATDAEAA